MLDTHEPLIHIMALHALIYCERLFYLEEVEEIRLADASVYAGRTLHEELKAEEEGGSDGEWTSLEMVSQKLGLTGRMDCLRRRDGHLIPYEHKRGRPRREGKQGPLAWPADALQVSAYGLLLEEQSGCIVTEGRVRYHAENITVRVPLDDAARQAVMQAIARARELRRSLSRPAITQNDRLCIRCSLSPVCLPEEERLAKDSDWEPVRLFPQDRELKTIHVVEPSAHISRAGDTVKVSVNDSETYDFPIHEIGALVLHGYPQITTQALHSCAYNEIPVHWISFGGRYVAGLTIGAGSVQRRLRQYQALSEPGTCLHLARKLAMAKVEGALRYLLRATCGQDRKANGVDEPIQIMRSSLKQMAGAEGVDALRGHEGLAARAYFAALPALMRSEVTEELRLCGRNRRPPRDRFNALLGFGYALLYQAVMQAILAVGLEPAIGFFHTPRSSAHPLVMDLMEIFRVPLWDMVLLGSLNRLQWDSKADFEVTADRVWLSTSGKKKAIQLFEKRLEATWKHPVIGYSLSYGRLIELEVRLLEKEWSGQPGLFAKMRLR
jgi:CRISPR-associated protein Cas1